MFHPNKKDCFRKRHPISPLAPYKLFMYKALPKLQRNARYDFLILSGYKLTEKDVILRKNLFEKIRTLKIV